MPIIFLSFTAKMSRAMKNQHIGFATSMDPGWSGSQTHNVGFVMVWLK
jgi:hypothetical protein